MGSSKTMAQEQNDCQTQIKSYSFHEHKRCLLCFSTYEPIAFVFSRNTSDSRMRRPSYSGIRQLSHSGIRRHHQLPAHTVRRKPGGSLAVAMGGGVGGVGYRGWGWGGDGGTPSVRKVCDK